MNHPADTRHFEKLFKENYSKLCQYAWHFLKDRDEAEDVVQQFYIYLWEKREKLNIEAFFLYAQRAVRNRCLDKLLREDKFQYEPLDNLIYTLTENKENEEDAEAYRERVRQAVRQIPPKSRKIMLLHCLRDLKYKEVADLLGISVNTVKSQIAIAYRIFAEEMQDYLPTLLFALPFYPAFYAFTKDIL